MAEVSNSQQALSQDAASAAKKKERVKARWSLLREHLLGSRSSENIHSMNSFSGFHVLERTVIRNGEEYSNLLAKCSSVGEEGLAEKESSSWDFVQNSYTCRQGRNIQFVTREVKQQSPQSEQHFISQSSMKSRIEALLSHRNHGVDNTGNVRVWDCSKSLAGFLLSVLLSEECNKFEGTDLECSDVTKVMNLRNRIKAALVANEEGTHSDDDQEKCKIIELGAGQAGLAGLAVTSATISIDNMKPLHIVLTDGHPKCVENNRCCSKLVPKRRDVNIDSRLLLWDSSASGAKACQQIVRDCHQSSLEQSLGKARTDDDALFDICLASDCVHFQEFHDGLFATIARTLRVGGVAVLCQPKRGSSLSNFMTLVDAVNNANSNKPLFEMDLLKHFHPKVSKMHRSFESTNATFTTTCYDPNWHQPLLLVLQKCRPFDEDVDGELARTTVKTYLSVN